MFYCRVWSLFGDKTFFFGKIFKNYFSQKKHFVPKKWPNSAVKQIPCVKSFLVRPPQAEIFLGFLGLFCTQKILRSPPKLFCLPPDKNAPPHSPPKKKSTSKVRGGSNKVNKNGKKQNLQLFTFFLLFEPGKLWSFRVKLYN